MMITTAVPPLPAAAPAPAAAPKPTPASATPSPSPTTPSKSAPATTTPAPAGQTTPSGQSPDNDAAAAQAALIDKLEKTTAVDAMKQVDEHLSKLATLSIGGGTPEGAQSAKVASALLTDASMLLQHAHLKAVEQLRTMATELHMRMMSSASGLAFIGGQVSLAGQSKEAVKLADVIAGAAGQTKAAIADVSAAITPAAPAAPDAGAAPSAPPAAPSTPAAPPAAPAPNGNTGVVPKQLQDATPGKVAASPAPAATPAPAPAA